MRDPAAGESAFEAARTFPDPADVKLPTAAWTLHADNLQKKAALGVMPARLGVWIG
jgi:hypothetical protein